MSFVIVKHRPCNEVCADRRPMIFIGKRLVRFNHYMQMDQQGAEQNTDGSVTLGSIGPVTLEMDGKVTTHKVCLMSYRDSGRRIYRLR